MKKISCFIPFYSADQVEITLNILMQCQLVKNVYGLSTEVSAEKETVVERLRVSSLYATDTYRAMAAHADAEYTLLYLQDTPLELGPFALERLLVVAEDTNAGMLYADHYRRNDEGCKQAPVIDYQLGSLRDDFDFGSLLLFKTARLKEAVSLMENSYQYAGLYDLRLRISEQAELVHVNEYLYTEVELDSRTSGEKQFDYVNSKNRAVQIEMEEVCTAYLKRIGAYLAPSFESVVLDAEEFEWEASVIIPVRNRIRTLADAIQSVLSQQTRFRFNLIIVDNHSTDGTSELIEKYAVDERIIHLIPERQDLGIGGCWNAAIEHSACGRFAVQLDSDDVYSAPDTLQKIVDAFYEQQCVMLVGTYLMTDFHMQAIPPGIIDHREWTPENGRNNALRIHGLGAPRAFYTPLLRNHHLPNTSYGEDYAIGLRISRTWQIGRLYDVLYYCRRWEDNSDAVLDIVQMNRYHTYKDRIRTWELQARIRLNQREND